MNSKTLSMCKAISWRFIGSFLSFLVVYVMSGDVKLSINASIVETVLKTGLYYFHDRSWNFFFIKKIS